MRTGFDHGDDMRVTTSSVSPGWAAILAPQAQGLLRIVTGFLFFQHGFPKLFGPLPGAAESRPPVELASLIGDTPPDS